MTTGVPAYSTTPASNVQANTGVNWDEGMSPGAVNNSARANMADLRTAFNDLIWFQYGSGTSPVVTPAYASGTSFTVAGIDVTAVYHAGRRVKAVGSGTGTIYGTVSSSSFSTNTTVNVTWDSGSLTNEALAIYLSQAPVTGKPWPSIGFLSPEGTVASAATTDLSTSSALRQNVTGNTTITSLGSGANLLRILRFSASLTLTYDGTALITPTAANIQTAAGDIAIVASDGSGNWRVEQYLPAGGVLLSSFNGVNLASSYAQVAAVTLTPGKWRLSANVTIIAAVSATYMNIAISTTTASNTGAVNGLGLIAAAISAVPVGCGAIPALDVTVAASTTYYLNVVGNGTGTSALAGNLRAERII